MRLIDFLNRSLWSDLLRESIHCVNIESNRWTTDVVPYPTLYVNRFIHFWFDFFTVLTVSYALYRTYYVVNRVLFREHRASLRARLVGCGDNDVPHECYAYGLPLHYFTNH